MTKQETSIFMAEKVLGFVKINFVADNIKDLCTHLVWEAPDTTHRREISYLTQFICSPEGFFAVWDALENSKPVRSIVFTHNEFSLPCTCKIDIERKRTEYGHGKDRYKAFYNAVMEVWG